MVVRLCFVQILPRIAVLSTVAQVNCTEQATGHEDELFLAIGLSSQARHRVDAVDQRGVAWVTLNSPASLGTHEPGLRQKRSTWRRQHRHGWCNGVHGLDLLASKALVDSRP
jgi:hypothetical protein